MHHPAMAAPSARVLGSLLGGLALVVGAVNLVVLLAVGRTGLLLSPDALVPLTASGIGLIVVRRVPGNPVGWLLLGAALSSALFGASALVVLESPPVAAAVATTAAWLSAWVWLPSYVINFFFLPVLFPDGRAMSPRWRLVVRAGAALLVMQSFLLAFGSEESVDPAVANPFALAPVTTALAAAEPVVFGGLVVLVVLGAVSVLLRFARSQGAARVQVLCVLVAAGVGLAYYALTRSGLALAVLLPPSIAVAVLRYRLYDVERLLGRTLLYGGLAGAATAVYVAVVVGAGRLLGAERDLRLQAAALVAAVLVIHPLRDHFLALAHRLVHGRRSGPYEALAQLARQVGGAVGPDETLPHMAHAIASALSAREVTVTAALPNGGALTATAPAVPEQRASDDEVVERVVVHQGNEVGRVRVRRDSPLSAHEAALLDVLVAQAGPSLHAVALTGQLREQLARAVEQGEQQARLVQPLQVAQTAALRR